MKSLYKRYYSPSPLTACHHMEHLRLLIPFHSAVMLYAALFVLIMSLEFTEASQFHVKRLPGFTGDLPFTLETGYIGVGEHDEIQLFYYFIVSEGNPKEDPLIFWLAGGPGCSGISGLLYEIGPLGINYANSTSEKTILELNPYSWTKVASIIFIDQPTGTGFSYAKAAEDYISNDTISTFHSYAFLKKWLMDHPKFLNNPLYVGGESYTGIVVPMVVQEIYNGNEVGEEPHINIKGYFLSNPFTDTSKDISFRIQYAHRMAFLSDAIYKSVKENCKGEYLKVDPNNSLCIHDLTMVDKCLLRIARQDVLYPSCDYSSWFLKSNLNRRGLGALDNIYMRHVQRQGCQEDIFTYVYVWANNIEVQEALHVSEEFGDTEWVRCNNSIRGTITYTKNVPNVVGYHHRLANKHCRALIFSGDHDITVPYLSTLSWIRSLNMSVVDDWGPWFVDEQVAGYTMKYLKEDYQLTFATIKGGSHTPCDFKPKECSGMVTRWLADNNL